MFLLRNPAYARQVRGLWATRKAMAAHRREFPNCAYCGRGDKVHVHHVIPVGVNPLLAAEPSNLITLCAKRCHITVGHMGNWKTYNPAVRTVCNISGTL